MRTPIDPVLVEAIKEALIAARDELDKQQVLENNAPGLRPHPNDSHKSLLGGTSVKLGPTAGINKGPVQDASVSNESVYITEWTIKLKPSSNEVAQMAAESIFGMLARFNVNYDGDQFYEWQAVANPDSAPIEIPVAGKCFAVHGRRINVKLFRHLEGVQNDITMEIAIVPGRPMLWFASQLDTAVVNVPAVFDVVTFAQRVQLAADLTAADTFDFVSPGGTVLATLTAGVNNLNVLQPIPPGAAFVRYHTAAIAAKSVLCCFEVLS